MADCNRNRPTNFGEIGAPDPEEMAALDERAKALPDSIRHDLLSAEADPAVMGEQVLQGIRRNDLYILSHPEYRQTIRDRYEALLASFTDKSVTATRMALGGVLHNAMYAEERERTRRR